MVTPLDRLEDTESLRALRPAVQGRMPRAGMPDLLLEIMQRTGFAKAFTHLSERQATVEHFETSLCAALVAEAFNIGIDPVIRQDISALRRERLAWVNQNFIRPERGRLRIRVYAVLDINTFMPSSGLCRAGTPSLGRAAPSLWYARHNQRAVRNASSLSSAW